jgi:DNA invertase Pin-like site-specific DNA recombinase
LGKDGEDLATLNTLHDDLDRAGFLDVSDLRDIVRELHENGAHLMATEDPVDTGSAVGKCVFAEFEAYLRRGRQIEGIQAAKGEWRVQRTAEVDQCCRGSAAS